MPSTGAAFGNVGIGKGLRAQRGWVMQERILEPFPCSTDKADPSPFPPQVQDLNGSQMGKGNLSTECRDVHTWEFLICIIEGLSTFQRVPEDAAA